MSFLVAFEASPRTALRPIPAISTPGSIATTIVVAASGLSEVALDPLPADVHAIALRNRPVRMVHLVVIDESEGEVVLWPDANIPYVSKGLKDFSQVVLLDVDVEAGHVDLGLLLVRH